MTSQSDCQRAYVRIYVQSDQGVMRDWGTGPVGGTTQNQEKASKRADGLRALVRERGLLDVLSATEQLWSTGLSPRTIRIRETYVRNREMAENPFDADPWGVPMVRFSTPVDERRRPVREVLPPLARLLKSQGVAMQFHLTALFVAHCQAKPGRTWNNTIPLNRDGSSELSWLDLMSVPTTPKAIATQSSTTYTRNKLRQFRSALKLLADEDLMDMRKSGRGRSYADFSLLSEDASSSGAGGVEYRVPQEGEVPLGLPIEFFLQGWTHVLTKSEIAAYLMWRQLGAASSYVMASWQERAGLFGFSREVYDTHQALEAFGLIRVVKPRERRDDGTWRGYSNASQLYSHRVHVLPQGLWRRADMAVEKALRKAAALGKWSKPLDT